MDPNLIYPIILNPTLNATLNATLYSPAKGLDEWLQPSVLLAIAQFAAAFALVIYTIKLSNSTKAYANQVEIQTKIMNKNIEILKYQANIDAKKRRYKLLKEEMDKLVAPLYIAYRSTQAANSTQGEPYWGFFIPIGTRDRGDAGLDKNFQLWDGIRMNMHLSHSEEFRKSIFNYLIENDNYWLFGKKHSQKKFGEARIKLLRAIMKRYPELAAELDIAEKEISSAETELSTISKLALSQTREESKDKKMVAVLEELMR